MVVTGNSSISSFSHSFLSLFPPNDFPFIYTQLKINLCKIRVLKIGQNWGSRTFKVVSFRVQTLKTHKGEYFLRLNFVKHKRMKKLRWAMDGGFWDLDMSTPVTIDGLARAVPGDPLPLGLSRKTKLSRPKQIDFMQRFMAMPFVPCYAGDLANGGKGFALQRVLTLPFTEDWFATLIGQVNVQKLVSSIKESGLRHPAESSWLKNIGKHLSDKSLYALGICSEFLFTPDDTLLLSSEIDGETNTTQKKAVFHHKFPRHNLTMEAVWPGLFVDKSGTYWDVPLLMEMDVASVAADSGSSFHLCIQNNAGDPKQFDGDQSVQTPQTLLPGLSMKSAFSLKKNIDIWRSKAGKLKRVQPFDIFLSDPHISASGIIGAVATAAIGKNSVRAQREDECLSGIKYCGPGDKYAFLADLFASATCTAQHGNFQRHFLDLTRVHARLDFPSGSKLLTGAARLAEEIYNSRPPHAQAVQAVCPDVTLSLQQQIVGEFSFRVDSRLAFNLESGDWRPQVSETIYALEYALKVLCSAKAVAWYSTKKREAMVELRFFET